PAHHRQKQSRARKFNFIRRAKNFRTPRKYSVRLFTSRTPRSPTQCPRLAHVHLRFDRRAQRNLGKSRRHRPPLGCLPRPRPTHARRPAHAAHLLRPLRLRHASFQRAPPRRHALPFFRSHPGRRSPRRLAPRTPHHHLPFR